MAGRIPQTFINDLLDRVDIVDVIEPRLALKKAGKNYQALCPFHTEKTPSFSVAPDKQFYHCFGCGVSGTALTFLMEFDRMDFVEAVETLAGSVGMEVPREAGYKPGPDNTDLYQIMMQATRYYQKQLKASPQAVAYLRDRGLTGMVARDFGMGFAPPGWDSISKGLAHIAEKDLLQVGLLTRNDKGRVYARFRERIMFPIRDTKGRVIAFGGRLLPGEGDGLGPKYLNSPETPIFHKGEELYGLYEARQALRRIDSLIVVEGYMDVVALAQAGIANCVATLGTSTSVDHFRKLFRATDTVVCCFDGDQAGRQAAWRALENGLPVLKEGLQLRFLFLPDGEDPDTLVRKEGRERFEARVSQATPAIEYLFGRISDAHDLSSLDGRASFAAEITPYLARVGEGLLKQMMRSRLQSMTGLQVGQVERPRADPSVAARSTAPLSLLAERLLGYLLKEPALLQELPESGRTRLLEAQSNDLFLNVVKYIDKNPETDVAEIFARWSGEAEQSHLIRLFERPVVLDATGMRAEFVEGVEAYLKNAERLNRRQMLTALKDNPTRENFEQLVSVKKGLGDGK
jgi:DNA primase